MLVHILFLLLVASTSAPAAGLGLGLSPMREEFHFAPGRSETRLLSLSNTSDETTRVRAEVLDFKIDNTATPQFSRYLLSESEFSCRTWLSVNPMETDVPAQQTLTVRYTVQVPLDTPVGGYHCAVGFRTLSFTTFPVAGIRSAVRIVATFYVLVGEPTINASPIALKLAQHRATARWQAVLTLDNRGRRYFRPRGTVTLLNEYAENIETVSIPSVPILPQRKQQLTLPLDKVEAGRSYTLRLQIDLGGGEIIKASQSVFAQELAP